MKSNTNIYWLLQTTGWMGFASILVLYAYITSPQEVDFLLITKTFIHSVVAIFFTHMMRDIVKRRGWIDMNLMPVIPRVIMLSMAVAAGIVIVNRLLVLGLNTVFNLHDTLLMKRLFIDWIANSIIVLFWSSIYFTYCFFRRYYYQEINTLTMEYTLREAELKNLQNQLNPHFLFNGLNSVKALVDLDPSKAKEAIAVLSSVIRGSLASNNGMIELHKEMDLVRKYLKIEQLRFEDRLRVDWDVPESLNLVKIPVFLLKSLVENAVKHGIAHLQDGGTIYIKIHQNSQGLVIQVKNTGQLTTHEETYAISLENTKRRLDLQYKNRANLLCYEENDMVVSQILLKNENEEN